MSWVGKRHSWFKPQRTQHSCRKPFFAVVHTTANLALPASGSAVWRKNFLPPFQIFFLVITGSLAVSDRQVFVNCKKPLGGCPGIDFDKLGPVK